jgi:hypothetical protein
MGGDAGAETSTGIRCTGGEIGETDTTGRDKIFGCVKGVDAGTDGLIDGEVVAHAWSTVGSAAGNGFDVFVRTTGASGRMVVAEVAEEAVDGGVGSVTAMTTRDGGSVATDAVTTGSDESVSTVTIAGRGSEGGKGLGGMVDGRTGRDGTTGTDTDRSLWMAVVAANGVVGGVGSVTAMTTRDGGSVATDAATTGSDESVSTVTIAGRGSEGGKGLGGMVDGRTGRDGTTGTDTDRSLWMAVVADALAVSGTIADTDADADADANTTAPTGAGVLEGRVCDGGVGIGIGIGIGIGMGIDIGMGGGGGKSVSGGGGGSGKARAGLGSGRAGLEAMGDTAFLTATGSTFLPIGKEISMSISLAPKSLSSVNAKSIFLRVDAIAAMCRNEERACFFLQSVAGKGQVGNLVAPMTQVAEQVSEICLPS